MKGRSVILSALVFLMLFPLDGVPCLAQDGFKDANGKIMPYIIEGNDTVYLSPLAAARVYEKKKRKKGRQWRKYYRLVYNFAKVYPYAVVSKDIVFQADSTIKADNLARSSKDKYVNYLVKELFHSFETPLRNLTISQGELLMKLIGRECGFTPYEIILEFKNKFSAGFWQAIAKLFGEDLKKPYDPDGKDEAVEDLVEQWKNGTFEQTYFEIFWKYPPMVEVPEKYNKPNLNQAHAVIEPPEEKKK